MNAETSGRIKVATGTTGEASVPARHRRFRAVSKDRELAIYEATLELLAEVGFENLSMDALAERAKASKATLYRHWSGKAELVAEAIRCCRSETTETPDTGSLRGDLIALLVGMAESLLESDVSVIAGVLWASRTDDVLGDLVQEKVKAIAFDKLTTIAEQAVLRGELESAVDLKLTCEVLPALVFMRLLIWDLPLDMQAVTELVDGIVLPVLTSSQGRRTDSNRQGSRLS